MSTRIVDEEDPTNDILIVIQKDGRILLEKGGVGIYLERDMARQAAMVIVGITQLDRLDRE